MSYHNFAGFRDPAARGPAQRFDQWLRAAATSEPTVRDRELARWAEAPAARQAHPREEHLLPLMVVAGAAGQDVGETAFNGLCFGKEISAFHFG
jgi:aromatic ring-opening dioxygenase catalytic subunit (LigB family)